MRDEKVVSGGGSSPVGKHETRECCCLFRQGPGISDVISPGFALWGRCPRRTAKVDGWMGEELTEGLTPILEGLQGLKERRKSIWKKK